MKLSEVEKMDEEALKPYLSRILVPDSLRDYVDHALVPP